MNACLQQRHAFAPFVTSVDGLLGLEARSVLKQLASQLAVKCQKLYSQICGIDRSRIIIDCVRATHQCICGTCVPIYPIGR